MTRKIKFFEDLIVSTGFKLGNQKAPKDFPMHYDESKTQKYDIKEGDKWKTSPQTRLSLKNKLKDFSKPKLLNWLDQNVKRREYTQDEKGKFLKKLIESLLESKKYKYDLAKLTLNMYKLKEKADKAITELEHKVAKKSFDDLVKKKKIVANSDFVIFPSEDILTTIQSEEFNKHLYEKAGKMNDEELKLVAERLDVTDNIKWWYRSVERKRGAFFIQGWHRDKFFPDFIVKTESGKYVVIEYKGEMLETNIDTDYKRELGAKWAELAGDDYYFYLVGKAEIDELIDDIKKL